MKTFHHPARPWAHFIKKTRSFFEEKGFLEVFTPCLVPVGAFENAIDTLSVHSHAEAAELQSSPEMAMKQVLAQEQCAIYQISHCFRDDPDTSIHFKEFNLLEFYRPYCNYHTTQKDMKELFNHLSPKPLTFLEFSIDQLFQENLKINLLQCQDIPSLKQKAEEVGVKDLTHQDSWEDIFFRIMLDKIEPGLPFNTPCLVFDYPATVSTLSIQKGFWGERFEIFWKGMELCNGATELTSPEVLKSRYEFESLSRKKSGKTPHPFPIRFFESLKTIPPCSGVAVGLDRLFWSIQS